jgi:TPR repeat protein
MRRAVLDVAGRRRAAPSKETKRPLGNVAAAALGAAAGATLVIGAQALTRHMLYTDEPCGDLLARATALDARADTAENQAHFARLMESWTKAAELYLQASNANCPKAQCALGRLCYEGRGYVYDPEYGIRLYEQAASAGNADAMYALACIALRIASVVLPAADPSSAFEAGNKRRYLYEGACLLRRARDAHEGARSALSDFSLCADPTKWMTATFEYLEETADVSAEAHSHILRMHPQSFPFTEWDGLARWQIRRPAVGTGGWREAARRIDDLGVDDARVAVRALLEGTSTRSTDAHEMASVASVGLAYLRTEEDPDMRKKAVALLDAAADRGDVGAIVEKWGDGTRNKHVHESDPATVSRLNMLDRGVSAGSRWLRYQRGLVYETRGSERAIEDLYDAAELGHWDALVACRARHRTLSEEDLLNGFGVIVLPIPAALAMTLDRAVVVASAADSAVFRALGIGASEPTVGATVVAQGETESGQKWIQAAWPDLRTDRSAALGLLYAAYQQILAAAQEEWVVLHPPPDLLFGPLPRPRARAHRKRDSPCDSGRAARQSRHVRVRPAERRGHLRPRVREVRRRIRRANNIK